MPGFSPVKRPPEPNGFSRKAKRGQTKGSAGLAGIYLLPGGLYTFAVFWAKAPAFVSA